MNGVIRIIQKIQVKLLVIFLIFIFFESDSIASKLNITKQNLEAAVEEKILTSDQATDLYNFFNKQKVVTP